MIVREHAPGTLAADGPPADRGPELSGRARARSARATRPRPATWSSSSARPGKPRGRRDPRRRRPRGRERDRLRPARARGRHRGVDRDRAHRLAISSAAVRAEKAAAGSPGDAVVWEEVESRTSENIELSAIFLAFMALACLIAVGRDHARLADPDHRRDDRRAGVRPDRGALRRDGPAAPRRRQALAAARWRSGSRSGSRRAFLFALAIRGRRPDPRRTSPSDDHPLTDFISNPDAFSFIVAVRRHRRGALADLGEVRAPWSASWSR